MQPILMNKKLNLEKIINQNLKTNKKGEILWQEKIMKLL